MGSSNHSIEEEILVADKDENKAKKLKKPKERGDRIAIPSRSLSNASVDSLDSMSTHEQISSAFTARQRRKDALSRSINHTKEDVLSMKGPYEVSDDDLALFEDKAVLKKKTKLKVKKLLKQRAILISDGAETTAGLSTLSSMSGKTRASRQSHTSVHSSNSRLSRAQREKIKVARKERQALIKSSLFDATDDALNEPDLFVIPMDGSSVQSKATKSSKASKSSKSSKKTAKTLLSSSVHSNAALTTTSSTSSGSHEDEDDTKSFDCESVDEEYLLAILAANKDKLAAIVNGDDDDDNDNDDDESVELDEEDFDLEDYEYVAMMMQTYNET